MNLARQTGYDIFVSFSTALPAVSEAFAVSDILSERFGKRNRSNTISCVPKKNSLEILHQLFLYGAHSNKEIRYERS